MFRVQFEAVAGRGALRTWKSGNLTSPRAAPGRQVSRSPDLRCVPGADPRGADARDPRRSPPTRPAAHPEWPREARSRSPAGGAATWRPGNLKSCESAWLPRWTAAHCQRNASTVPFVRTIWGVGWALFPVATNVDGFDW